MYHALLGAAVIVGAGALAGAIARWTVRRYRIEHEQAVQLGRRLERVRDGDTAATVDGTVDGTVVPLRQRRCSRVSGG